ncbi:MAG TPA: YhbY family RNA-binding protein [Opitutaceae bacterium]|nr:YhbY family RNA-binding protein [Opitutaceae bacterium]
MYDFPLTGAQKTYLRGLGQRLDPTLKVGKSGLTPEFYKELQRCLNGDELIKIRFLGADRDERATLCETIADQGRCVCVGAVGHTALFFRRNANPERQSISLPD